MRWNLALLLAILVVPPISRSALKDRPGAPGPGGGRVRREPPSLGSCLEALGDTRASARRDAACSLGLRGDWEAVGPLLARLRDPAGGVREAAAEALGRVSGLDFGYDADDGEAAREAAVGSWERWWRQARGLGRRDALRLALGEGRARTRASACEALARHGDASVVPALLERLGDAASGVRARALAALVAIAGEAPRYNPDGAPGERALDLERLRAWWAAREAGVTGPGERGR